MDKKALRKELINRRDNMDHDTWWSSSSLIQRNILKSPIYRDADLLLLYSDYRNEVETVAIIEAALADSKPVYLPKIELDFDGIASVMTFYRIYSTFELVEGYKGINEPMSGADRIYVYDEKDTRNILMLVPGVGFDKNKNRLGFGKGFYDKFLCDKANILKVGIGFDFQVMDELPTEENDIVLDYLITESTPHREIEKYSFK